MARKRRGKGSDLGSRILDALNHQKKPISISRLASLLDTPDGDETFRATVARLRADGLVYAARGHHYASAQGKAAREGCLSVHERGFGFVALDGGGDDVYIAARRMSDALDGDRVLITMSRNRSRPGLTNGEVLGVIERSERPVVGTIHRGSSVDWIHPDDSSLPDIQLAGPLPREATEGLTIVGRLAPVTLTDSTPVVQFERVLGSPNDPDTAMRAIIEKHGLRDSFPAATMRDTERIQRDIPAEEIANRRDLRSWEIVTIDPADAADLDDALSLTRDESGRAVVGIHIADVSHYVATENAIDDEAVARGTSVYLPGHTIHMLPNELSAGMCSLLPDVDRLAVSVFVTLDETGSPTAVDIARTVIRSRAKLSYEQVEAVLTVDDDSGNPATKFAGLLRALAEVAHGLTASRIRDGALDFDVPVVKVEIGEDGHVSAIRRRDRLTSHRLVEECMLLANRSVAHRLAEQGYDLLYRIHDAPDPAKLEEVVAMAAALGHVVTSDEARISVEEIQALLKRIAGEPIAPVVETHLLRAMAKAVYSPENIGHYALAMDDYAHFTSPIRRYPDLVVHRQVKRMLAGKPSQYDRETLGELGRSTSAAERTAEQAERDAIEVRQAEFMSDHVGDEFAGTISGVTRSGLFVVLSDSLAEGFIPADTLPDDDYRFDGAKISLTGRRTRASYHMGDPVTVLVARADIAQGRIDFDLIDAPHSGRKRRGGQETARDGRDRSRRKGKRSSSRRGKRHGNVRKRRR